MSWKYRIIYGILWLLTLIAYSVPWIRADDTVYVGWNFTIPFSITYLIGLLLGLIVLAIKWKPVVVTVIAGILMLLGILGAFFGIGMMKILGTIVGKEVVHEAGIGFAFLMSIIYMVCGAIVGKRIK